MRASVCRRIPCKSLTWARARTPLGERVRSIGAVAPRTGEILVWGRRASQVHALPRAHGVVVSHPLSMREALGSIPSVSMLRVTPDICPNRAKPNTRCTFCTILIIPAIAQLVEHLTVDPAAIRWSLVRFRVAGQFQKRDFPTSQQPACCTSKGTPGFEPGTC